MSEELQQVLQLQVQYQEAYAVHAALQDVRGHAG